MKAYTSLTVLVLLSATAALHAQAYKAPRTADGKPNLNGIWQAMNAANWDLEGHAAEPGPVTALGAAYAVPPGLSVVEGGNIPYLPAALAKKKDNFEKRLSADPEIKCYMPGVPRATYMPYPFQIFQSAKTMMFTYEFSNAVRTIYMENAGESPVDTWMGWSAGRWDGDTLVIDVTSLNDQTWFDRAGNYHSDALHVVERYTPTSANTLNYEATMEDSKVFSRPWKISMPLYRHVEPNAQLLEYKCVEFAEPVIWGPLSKRPNR